MKAKITFVIVKTLVIVFCLAVNSLAEVPHTFYEPALRSSQRAFMEGGIDIKDAKHFKVAQLAIAFLGGGAGLCSGTRFGMCILTAAHCLQRFNEEKKEIEKALKVRTYSGIRPDLKEDGEQYSVNYVSLWEDSGWRTTGNDLAVVKLNEEPENNYKDLSFMADEKQLKAAILDEDAHPVGYGLDGNGVGNVFRTGDVTLNGLYDTGRFGYAFTDKENHLDKVNDKSRLELWSTPNSARLGWGDSGGPLLDSKGRVLGVASGVYAPVPKGAPYPGSDEDYKKRAEAEKGKLNAKWVKMNKHAPLAYHLDWIKEKSGKNHLDCFNENPPKLSEAQKTIAKIVDKHYFRKAARFVANRQYLASGKGGGGSVVPNPMWGIADTPDLVELKKRMAEHLETKIKGEVPNPLRLEIGEHDIYQHGRHAKMKSFDHTQLERNFVMFARNAQGVDLGIYIIRRLQPSGHLDVIWRPNPNYPDGPPDTDLYAPLATR